MIPYQRASALNRRISQVPLSSSGRSHLSTSLTFAFYSSRPDHFKTKSELKSAWLSAVSQWREFASAAGVRDINAAEVEPALDFRQTGTSLSKLGDATKEEDLGSSRRATRYAGRENNPRTF